MYNTLLFGIILLVLGFSLLVKTIFGLDLPIFRLLIAGFFIYFGFMILVGGKPFEQQWIMFSEKIINPDVPTRQYNIIFGKGTIDLTNITIPSDQYTIKVNTIFGEAVIKTDANIPTHIRAQVTFGETILPNKQRLSYGSDTYSTATQNIPIRLHLESNTILGNTKIQTI